MLLLKVAIGQTYDIRWADVLGEDIIILPPLDANIGSHRLSYEEAISAIISLERKLSLQRKDIEETMAERAAIIEQGDHIHGLLDGLSHVAVSQKKQDETLEMLRKNIRSQDGLLIEFEKLSGVSFANEDIRRNLL